MESYKIFLVIAVTSSIVLTGSVLWTIREPKNPRWLDVWAAILLLLIAGFTAGLIQGLLNDFPTDSIEEKELKVQYQIALLLIPFFTANLATNLLAHAILAKRDYAGQLTFWQAVGRLFVVLLKASFLITPLGIAMYLYYFLVVRPTELNNTASDDRLVD